MMPLRRARGFLAFDSFDRDADARLRLNQLDPLSDIDISRPAGQATRRRVMAQIIQLERLLRREAAPIAGNADRRLKPWTFVLIKIPLKSDAVQSLVDQWLRCHTADLVFVSWFTKIAGCCCFFHFG
jgi:hypothetical protein